MPEITALHGTGSSVCPKPDSRCHHIEMWLQESQSHTDSFALYAVPPMSPLKNKNKTKQLCEFDPLAMVCPWFLLDHSPAHSIPIRLLPFDCCCLKPRKGQVALQKWHGTLPQCVVLGGSCGSRSDVGYGFPEFTR